MQVNSRSSVRRISSMIASGVLLAGGLVAVTATPAQAAPIFTTYTTANGLGNNVVLGVFAEDDTVYAATEGGLAISTDGGATFTNYDDTNSGIGGNNVFGVFAVGATVYAATSNDYGGVGGLSISTDGGATFTNYTTTNGLRSNVVRGVHVVGSTIYAATDAGLSISTNGGTTFTDSGSSQDGYGVYAVATSPHNTVYFATHSNGLFISTDGGANFTNYDDNDGLSENDVNGVFAVGSTIYAATIEGLAISTDINATPAFINYVVADGLVDDFVNGVYAVGTTVYAATEGGLSITTDGGATFTNYTSADGLGNDRVRGVYAVGGTIYAATSGGLSISVAATVPGAPSITSATPGNGSALIAFTGPGSDGGAAITNYEYSLDGGSNWVALSPASTTSPFTVSGVTNGQTYSVTLRARNSVGAGAASAPATVTPQAPAPPPVFPPSAPQDVVGVPGDREVVVSWQPPASAGSFPVSEYLVTAGPGGQTCLTKAPALTCTVTGLTNGTAYTFVVKALNGAGWGGGSRASSPVTPSSQAVRSLTLFQGTRAADGRHDRIRTGGTSVGVPAGSRLTPWIRYGATGAFKEGAATIVVDDKGGFTWTRQIRKDRAFHAYVAFEDVESNRVIWQRVR